MVKMGYFDVCLEGKSSFFNSPGWYFKRGEEAMAWQEAEGDDTLLYGESKKEGDQG